MDVHDIQVKTLLTAEEFLAFRGVCEAMGVSMSSRLRMLVKVDIREMVTGAAASMDD